MAVFSGRAAEQKPSGMPSIGGTDQWISAEPATLVSMCADSVGQRHKLLSIMPVCGFLM